MVGEGEDLVGFAELPKNARGRYEYASEFEIIAPAPGQPSNEVIFIDSENRGGAVMLNLVNEAGVQGPPSRARYAEGVGNGFLQRHATSYARVQWQTGIAKDVPATAQGIGLVMPPVITTSIDDTCGNRGKFQPFTAAELTKKCGSKENYLHLYGQRLAKFIEQGFLLQEDEVAMLGYASYLWDNAEAYIDRSQSASSQ